MKIQANGSAEFENIFARISDSKRDSNGFQDPATAAECGFIFIFLGPDFGLCLYFKYFCPDFGFRAKMEGRTWFINHKGSADLHTPIHPPVRGTLELYSGLTQ